MKGYVKWFNDKLGYGFIKSEEIDKDIFIHYSEINKKGYKKLNENDIVIFKYDEDKNKAYDLKIINSSNRIKLIKNIKKATDNNIDIKLVEKDNRYNITNTPALVINDKIISQGKVLNEREIKKFIEVLA